MIFAKAAKKTKSLFKTAKPALNKKFYAIVTNTIPKIAKATPILFFRLNFSLNNSKPTNVDTITIATLFMVNKVELSKFLFCKALIIKKIEQ
jgi:hypothetical protein